MNIVIINDYAGSPEYGMTFRHYYLAKEFVRKGHEVTIISASYSHFMTKLPPIPKGKQFLHEVIDGIKYIWLKVPKYNASFDKRRIMKWFVFTMRLFFIRFDEIKKPTHIICATTAPFAILPARFHAKRYGARLVFEVRDIWPLTLTEIGGYSNQNPFIWFMRRFELFALKKADLLVSNLPNYNTYLQDIGLQRTAKWIPNGIDLTKDGEVESLPEDVISKIPHGTFVVGYTGKIGVSNNLDNLARAAEFLIDNKNMSFVIVGTGTERERLMKEYAHCSNLVFIPPIPRTCIPNMLAYFDVCYIGLNKLKLFEYGVSPNKLFDYMLSGKPIIHAITTTNDIVKNAECGITVEAQESEAVADAAITLSKLSEEERKKMGENGRRFVKKNHDYSVLAKQFLELLAKPESNKM